MEFYDDPSMKEVIKSFCLESIVLLGQLEELLVTLEESPSESKELAKFGQIIDRMMGAAKSLNAEEIASFCELGKVIGYKASQINDIDLLKVVVAILFDATDLLKLMINKLETGDDCSLKSLNTKAFATRLKWLSGKFKDIERASCELEKKEEDIKQLSQSSIDDLLNSLGL